MLNSIEDWMDDGTGDEFDRGYDFAMRRAMRIIRNAPVVDAVPVVRCKDCEYTDTEVGLPDGALYCNEWSSVVRSYWYCCRGARMDGEENAAD